VFVRTSVNATKAADWVGPWAVHSIETLHPGAEKCSPVPTALRLRSNMCAKKVAIHFGVGIASNSQNVRFAFNGNRSYEKANTENKKLEVREGGGNMCHKHPKHNLLSQQKSPMHRKRKRKEIKRKERKKREKGKEKKKEKKKKKRKRKQKKKKIKRKEKKKEKKRKRK